MSEREAILRAAVAAMPHTNPGVADDLIGGFTMHTEAEDIIAIWQAARALAAPTAPTEPVAVGWKRVPIEPTYEMQTACLRLVDLTQGDPDDSSYDDGRKTADLIYRAMLAATPTTEATSSPSHALTGRVRQLEAERDAITELNHAQWLALENVRHLSARNRNEEWAQHMLRWCTEAGNAARILRAAPTTEATSSSDAEPTDAWLDEQRAAVGTGIHRDLYNRIVRQAILATKGGKL